jgi:hypothetical protein
LALFWHHRLAALIHGSGKEEEEDDLFSKQTEVEELFISDEDEGLFSFFFVHIQLLTGIPLTLLFSIVDESFGSGDEESGEDEIDSDFDAPEIVPDTEDDATKVKINDINTGRKNVYKDPVVLKAKKEAAEKKKGKKAVQDNPPSPRDEPAPKRVYVPVPPRNSERPSLRNSTKMVTAAVVARKKAIEERNKLRPPKVPKIVKIYTQEELLEESKETAKLNRESLLELMKYEENMKRIELKKRAIDGPKVRYISNKNGATITFTEVDRFPHAISQDPVHEYPRKKVCPISGKPARYFDPLTQTHYADIKAFQILRATYEVDRTRAENQFVTSISRTMMASNAAQSSTNSSYSFGTSYRKTDTSNSSAMATDSTLSSPTGGRSTRSNPGAPSTTSTHTATTPAAAAQPATETATIPKPKLTSPKQTTASVATTPKMPVKISAANSTPSSTHTTPSVAKITATLAKATTSSSSSNSSPVTGSVTIATAKATAKPTQNVVKTTASAVKVSTPTTTNAAKPTTTVQTKMVSSIPPSATANVIPRAMTKISTVKPTTAATPKVATIGATPTANLVKVEPPATGAPKRSTLPTPTTPTAAVIAKGTVPTVSVVKAPTPKSVASKPTAVIPATTTAIATHSNKMDVDEAPAPPTSSKP